MTKANPTLLDSGTFYLAELTTGLLVGCGGWTREIPGTTTIEPGVGHVRHVAVHPNWTRHGIGRAILNVCERAGRAAGVRAFDCYSSLNAVEFYAALDFKRISEMEIAFSPEVALRTVLMRREIQEG
jgi:N-acetylglutamate synthase-like GNAT family acetyltransferase